MKKSDITVSMPMSAFEEYEQYKKKYYELKAKVCSLMEKCGKEEGFDYRIDVKKTIAVVKEVSIIPSSSNIQIIM